MSKEEILHYFQDINYMYNDCSMKDTLSKCLDEYAEEVRAEAIDELFNTPLEDGTTLEYSRYREDSAYNFYNLGWNACYDTFRKIADKIKEQTNG